jgi:hypothetical protein
MKFKGKIQFSGERFMLDVSSREKLDLNPEFLSNEDIRLVKFNKEELFLGEHLNVNHIDHFVMNLASTPNYNFECSLSQGAKFTISYNNLNINGQFLCSYIKGELQLEGEIEFTLNIKDALSKDFKNSGLILFSSVGVRLGGGELLIFNKYGDDWEQERIEKKLFWDEGKLDFIQGRPKVSLL